LKRLVRPGLGLIGQIVAILLLTIIIEFGVSTLLYERASQFSVRDDEANRLAEHLVISRRLVAERPPAERPAMAAELTTDRYRLRWDRALPPPPPIAPLLDEMRDQVISWEPSLARVNLRLRLTSPGRRQVVTGGLTLPDGSWLYFSTTAPLGSLNLAVERVLLALVPAIALMVIGGALVRRTLQPLRQLAAAADRVGSGVEEHVEEEGPGEVVSVVRAFNRMQARIHKLIDDRTEALAAVGHDLRTPLARLRLRAEAIPEPAARDAIDADIGEMEAMVGSLLAYLGGDSDPEHPVKIDVAVMCATLADDAADRGRDVEYRGPDHCEMRVRPTGLKRALGNLVDNALHHADGVCITLEPLAHEVAITIEDDGPGIPEDKLAQVLEPFVRLDAARGRDTVGFGLGLPIVLRTVEAEGGRLTLSNREEGGLRARVTLPIL
jgi:signal transduction histidine kinase